MDIVAKAEAKMFLEGVDVKLTWRMTLGKEWGKNR